MVDAFDAAGEVLCADGAAEVNIAYVGDSGSVQSVMALREMEVYIDDFEPLSSGTVYIDCRAGAEAEGTEGEALQIEASIDEVFAFGRLLFRFRHDESTPLGKAMFGFVLIESVFVSGVEEGDDIFGRDAGLDVMDVVEDVSAAGF